MKISTNQLPREISNGLTGGYWLCGDEPLLIQESLTTLLEAANKAGFSDRIRLSEQQSDFEQTVFQQLHAPGLFADKQILILALDKTKFTAAARSFWVSLSEQLDPNTLVIITSGKLDKSTLNTKWMKQVMQHLTIVQAWPVDSVDYPNWLRSRLQSHQLKLEPEALDLLCHATAGNLLAAKQEIDKLSLLFPDSHSLTLSDISEAIGENACFDVFDLVNALHQRDPCTILPIMQTLKGKQVEPILVLWALSREIRNLQVLKQTDLTGKPLSSVFMRLMIWPKQQPLYQAKLPYIRKGPWLEMLRYCSYIDRCCKGIYPDDAWHALTTLALAIAKPSRFFSSIKHYQLKHV